MNEFPRTIVGGISMPRLIVGTNWFLGYSHTSLAKDKLHQRAADSRAHRQRPVRLSCENGIDAVMGATVSAPGEAIQEARRTRSGRA